MRLRGPIVLSAAVIAMVGCNGEKTSNADVLAQDSSLARDLKLADRDTLSQPQLRDVATTTGEQTAASGAVAPTSGRSAAPAQTAVAPAPAAPREQARRVAAPPAPPAVPAVPVHQRAAAQVPVQTTPNTPQSSDISTATPPNPTPVRTRIPAVMTPAGNTVDSGAASADRSTEGQVGVVAAGTMLALRTEQRVCTNTNTVGDRITATLADPLSGTNGVVIPAGSTAVLEVTSVQRSNQAGENMGLGLMARSVMYEGKAFPVDGEITDVQTEKVREPSGGDAGKVLGGAAVGAILGRVISGQQSKTKGTIIGAATGAAAGAVLANQTAKYDACIPSGSRVSVRLDSPMSVRVAP